MAKKRESRRQHGIKTKLREWGGRDLWCTKIHGGPFQDAGLPDIMGYYKGRGFAFEVKEPDGKPSELQLETIADMKRAGAVTGIITTAKEAIDALTKAAVISKADR